MRKFDATCTNENGAPKIAALKMAGSRGIPVSQKDTATPKFVMRSKRTVRKAPKTAVSPQVSRAYASFFVRP